MLRSLFVIAHVAAAVALAPSNTLAGSHDTARPMPKEAVLVTGATSGIGRHIAEHLAGNGYFVYAGARKQADIDALNAIPNMQAIRLDVTKPDDIEAAVATVRAAGRGLHGLVNNAGVIIAGPALEADIDDVEWLFDVNVYGVMRVTNAFAPLIIESRGRITTIGSIAGGIGIEWLGPYSMSKHAVEAYTDTLAQEMQRFGVDVSIIEPGNFSSKIWDQQVARAGDGLVDKDSPYAEDIANWIEFVAGMETQAPDAVAEAAQHALFADEPQSRYLVVPNEGEAAWIIGSLVTRLAQFNNGHAFSYTPAELLAMVEAALGSAD